MQDLEPKAFVYISIKNLTKGKKIETEGEKFGNYTNFLEQLMTFLMEFLRSTSFITNPSPSLSTINKHQPNHCLKLMV